MNFLYVDRSKASSTLQTFILIFLSQRNVHLEHMADFIQRFGENYKPIEHCLTFIRVHVIHVRFVWVTKIFTRRSQGSLMKNAY